MYDLAMRTIQDTDIVIPPHVDRLADAAAADPAVCSVVLYGSRSIGRYRPWSDWDIAVIVRGSTKPSDAVMSAGWEVAPKHGITVLDEEQMLAEMGVYASLASEIALGVVMRGVNYDVEHCTMAKRLYGTNTAEARSSYIAMMAHVWSLLRADIENVTECRQSQYAVAQPTLGGNSADASERVVKLTTLTLGLPFQATHDIHKLAKDLPNEWRERLKALNGNTEALHIMNYGTRALSKDELRQLCEQTEERLRLTMDVLADLLHEPNPLTPSDASQLCATITSPFVNRKVLAMVDECMDDARDLVQQFTSIRDQWIERLARDSINTTWG